MKKNKMKKQEKKQHRLRSQSGITLLEVMLAVVIIAVFIALLTVARDDIIARAVDSNSLRVARMLASQKMEELLLAEVTEEEEEDVTSGTFDNYPGFTWSKEVEDVSIITDEDREDNPDVEDRYVQRVTVKVEYKDDEGQTATYSLVTILPYKEEEESGKGQ